MCLELSAFGATQPEWFLKVTNSNVNVLTGFGESPKRQEAINIARKEIIETISVHIESEFKSYDDSNAVHESSSNISAISSLTLNGSNIIKIEKLDDVWYSKVEYLNIKGARALASCTKVEGEISYLNNTKFGKQMYNFLGYNASLNIYRQSNSYYISSNKDCSVMLSNNDVSDLLSRQDGDSRLVVPKVLHNGQRLIFKFSSHQKYRTLLTVEDTGKVGVIAHNVVTNSYPNNSKYIVVNNNTGHTINEMYILITSDKKIDVNFDKINEKVLDDSNFKMDELVEVLGNYNFTSKMVKIRK
jgi:hypothetical protein